MVEERAWLWTGTFGAFTGFPRKTLRRLAPFISKDQAFWLNLHSHSPTYLLPYNTVERGKQMIICFWDFRALNPDLRASHSLQSSIYVFPHLLTMQSFPVDKTMLVETSVLTLLVFKYLIIKNQFLKRMRMYNI